jgi:membrane protease YdiL (CAAX protease family)
VVGRPFFVQLDERDSGMRSLRIGRVTAFLVLTFALSWGFDLLIALTIGHEAYLELGLSPLGMFFPGFVALILRLFVFKDSPVHFRQYKGKPRWILYGFLLVTVAYGIVTVTGVLVRGQSVIFQGAGNLLTTSWTLLVFFVAGQSGKEELEKAGLQLGETDRGVKLALGVVVFLALQSGLNLLLRLGEFQGQAERVYGIALPDELHPLALIVAFGLAVTGVPLSGLAAVFGEEYGWRGLLQDELVKLGKRRGVSLVGLVWGLWHFPVILSGVHTYPSTILGLGLGLAFFFLWGFVQSYALLKARSIWVPAFLHGLVNSVYAFMLEYVVRPDSNVFSFGLGVYGLACLAVVVLFVLRDPTWCAGARER